MRQINISQKRIKVGLDSNILNKLHEYKKYEPAYSQSKPNNYTMKVIDKRSYKFNVENVQKASILSRLKKLKRKNRVMIKNYISKRDKLFKTLQTDVKLEKKREKDSELFDQNLDLSNLSKKAFYNETSCRNTESKERHLSFGYLSVVNLRKLYLIKFRFLIFV